MSIPTCLPFVVTAVTATTPIGITWTMSGPPSTLPTGTVVRITGVEGVNANGQFTITNTGLTTFTLNGTTGTGSYVRGGGFIVVGQELGASTLTAFDASLAIRVVDKTGDTLYGHYSADAGSNPAIDVADPTARILINAAGAKAQTSGSGQFFLSDGDEVLLDPPRTRSILVSCTEAFVEYYNAGGTLALIAAAAGKMGVISQQVSLGQAFYLPLTRMHDGATLVSAQLFFFPQLTNASLASVPILGPTLDIQRINAATDVKATSLSSAGAATYVLPSTVAAYASSAAVGATGGLALVTLNGGSASLTAGSTLTDAAGNTFQVVTTGTYANGVSVPVQAIAPAAPAPFFGATTNHAAGDVLTWTTTPTNCATTQAVDANGLTGGLNAGYAQSITFTPDAAKSVIDVSTYAYLAKFTDDSAGQTFGWNPTVYTAIKLNFANITSMRPQ